MSIGTAFWIIMLIWLLVGVAWNWPGNRLSTYGPVGNSLLLFVLLLLLGIHSFGQPLHG